MGQPCQGGVREDEVTRKVILHRFLITGKSNGKECIVYGPDKKRALQVAAAFFDINFQMMPLMTTTKRIGYIWEDKDGRQHHCWHKDYGSKVHDCDQYAFRHLEKKK